MATRIPVAADTTPLSLGRPQFAAGRSFIRRPSLPYANCAFSDYQLPETAHHAQREFFDQLGSHLLRGYDVYEWVQQRSTNWWRGVDRSAWSTTTFPNLVMVASESHKDWATAVIIGSTRQTWSPLTLNYRGQTGTQVDMETPHLSATVLVSPGSYMDERRTGWWEMGGHSELRLGALRLGATVFDRQQFDARQPHFTFTGDPPPDQPLPSFIVVRFLDDSPEDEQAGAYLQDVALYVNGQVRRDLAPDLVRINARNPTALGRRNRITGQFSRTQYTDEGTRYADYFALRKHLAGENVTNVNLDELVRWVQPVPFGSAVQVAGEEVLLAYFDLRFERHVRQVEVEALVGNDYRIEVLSLYERDPRQPTDLGRWAVGGVHTQRRASGNVQDLSNLRCIRFPVGARTASVLLGLDGHWSAYGGDLSWEYVRQLHCHQYPDGRPGYRSESEQIAPRPWRGAHHTETGEAWYAHFQWDAGRSLRYGFEVYHMGPEFRNTYAHGQVPSFGPGLDRDHDGYPDDNRNWNGIPDYDEPFLCYYAEPIDYRYGRDWDHNDAADGVEEVYWEDFGEDHPEYLYDVDQHGAHAFALWRLGGGVEATVGRLEAAGLSGGGRNDNTYAQVALRREGVGGNRLFLEHRVERVHDDIADDYALRVQQPYGELTLAPEYGEYVQVKIHDAREWRNSLGHDHYLEAQWHPRPGVTFDGNARYSVNHQRGGELVEGRDLGPDRISVYSWVLRGEWSRPLSPGVTVRARCKAMALCRSRRKGITAIRNEWRLIPVLRADWRLTPHSLASLGVQGPPMLPARLRDRSEPRNSRRDRAWVLQLRNTSDYLGYELGTYLGLRWIWRDYDDPSRQLEDQDIWAIFLKVVMGWDSWTNVPGSLSPRS